MMRAWPSRYFVSPKSLCFYLAHPFLFKSRVNNSFTQPPPRELMLELAAERNAQPLDPVPKKFGVLLPAEEFCLTNPIFELDLKK